MAFRREWTLLQRVRLGEQNSSDNSSINLTDLRRSILQHMQDLFNTREGDCKASPDFGLPDLSNFNLNGNFVGACDMIGQVIENKISDFEPRLRSVKVAYKVDESRVFKAHFKITAMINFENINEGILFNARMKNERDIEVVE